VTSFEERDEPADDEEAIMPVQTAGTTIDPHVEHSSPTTDRLPEGTTVEVRTRMDARRWAKGFEVADVDDDGYLLRRLSDKVVMPVRFAPDDVRRERRRSQWWY